jgi:hypothetical protein
MALFQRSILKKYSSAQDQTLISTAYFSEQKALALQPDITRIDAEIDQLVYELYGLTEEEIRIVEGE